MKMDSGALFSNILGMLVRRIIVPSDFHAQAEAVKEMQKDDVSGLVDSLTDYAVTCASVDYTVETDNEEFSKILALWLDEINSGYEGKIPSGIRPLEKEYFKERWKCSSFPVLKIAGWKKIGGIEVPDKMFFVDGASIKAKDLDDDSKYVKLINYEYYIADTEDETNKLDKDVIITKPYIRQFEKYPVPYLIKRGIYHNFKIIQSLKNKETSILDQIIPYLLLIKKGTDMLATSGKKVYTDPELKGVLKDIKKLIQKAKDYPEGVPARSTQFDETLEHFIPDLSTIFKVELFAQAERNILSGLGFIDIAEAVSESRRQSILNPKVFMEETRDGVEDFKQIIKELVLLIKARNKSHTKYLAKATFYITASPIKSFITDDFKKHLRLLWKNGGLSDQTYSEMVGEVDFRTEKARREKEIKDGTEILMYPHFTQNKEDKESFEELKRQQQYYEEKTDKDGNPLPPDKTEPEEKQEYDIGAKVKCECIECGYKVASDKHCNAFKCSKCGGEMRRIGRPGFGRPDLSPNAEGELEGAPYPTIKSLPARVKNNMSPDLQSVFRRAFNNAYDAYHNESRAFRIAWGVIKQLARKNKKGIWVRKRKRSNGQLVKVKLSKAMIEEVLEKEEAKNIDEAIQLKKLELMEKQTELANKLLGHKSKDK